MQEGIEAVKHNFQVGGASVPTHSRYRSVDLSKMVKSDRDSAFPTWIRAALCLF